MRLHRALQNRVDPFGAIHAVPARGTLMGNRGGCMHDELRQLGRRQWVSRRWIACILDFKGRRRTVMTPGRYTELFFLDEATALAAGHRPCFECRRKEAKEFAAIWARAFDPPRSSSADAMDSFLHAERAASRGATTPAPLVRPAALPDGAMVALRDGGDARTAWLVVNRTLRQWSFDGYGATMPAETIGEAELITPSSVVAVLRAGYRPRLHASA